jgi:hypothetical protein
VELIIHERQDVGSSEHEVLTCEEQAGSAAIGGDTGLAGHISSADVFFERASDG